MSSGTPTPSDSQTLNDPTISSGSTVVDSGCPTHKIHLVKGEVTSTSSDGDFFSGILASSEVRPGSQAGDIVFSSAIDVLQVLALNQSKKIWVFDDALAVGFGEKAKEWEEVMLDEEKEECADVVELQTREGAGSALSGFLANSTATGEKNDVVHSVFATTKTLPYLLPTLSTLPSTSNVIFHIATTSTNAETLEIVDDFSSVLAQLDSINNNNIPVYFSSTPQEIVDVSASLLASKGAAIHFFESTFAGRQVQDIKFPSISSSSSSAIPAYVLHKSTSSSTSAAEALLVLPASHTSNLLVRDQAVRANADILVISDWNDTSFGQELVSTGLPVKIVVSNANSTSGSVLKENILMAIYATSSSSKNVSKNVFPKISITVIDSNAANDDVDNIASQLGLSSAAAAAPAKDQANAKVVSFYSNAVTPVPALLSHIFLSSPTLNTRMAQFGSSVAQGVKSVLSLGPKVAAGASSSDFEPTLTPETRSDVVWITEPQILKQVDVLSTLNENGILVLVLPWSEEEVPSKLSASEINQIKQKNIRVFLLPPDSNPLVEQVAFLLLYTSQKMLSTGVKRVIEAFYGGIYDRNAIEEAQAGLTEIENVSEWTTVQVQEQEQQQVSSEEVKKPQWEWDALAGKEGVIDLGEDGRPERGDWTLAARKFLFKEAFQVAPEPSSSSSSSSSTETANATEDRGLDSILALQPSIEDKTYLVTVSENRRLTPETYDRNVFHIAFDTTGTGLEYAVGEALGVHGLNDEEEVRDFIDWYGLDPDALVSFPSAHDHGKSYETRTVFQLLQQNLDIFGKPGKAFYASLAGLAKSVADERTLRFIASPEGVALFKKMSEKETVTFVDVLRQFKTARPSFEELIGLIPEIKPRHYSIASSQKFSGNIVELLVVTVNWSTPSGSPRFGQCTRYLADLPVGAKVTVSIKPSVMKLPPLDTQPIIMAGLGTGAAPFRAFIQHRAWQASQGIEVGPLVYYFGSRYRSQEYLYGEEIEAYINSGIVSHAGLAFSRDGREKVYIQHKMGQDKEMLAKMLLAKGKDAAYFYLCGPTWPVPDVFEALVGSLTENGGMERKPAEDYIEELKEEERYVLEVY